MVLGSPPPRLVTYYGAIAGSRLLAVNGSILVAWSRFCHAKPITEEGREEERERTGKSNRSPAGSQTLDIYHAHLTHLRWANWIPGLLTMAIDEMMITCKSRLAAITVRIPRSDGLKVFALSLVTIRTLSIHVYTGETITPR